MKLGIIGDLHFGFHFGGEREWDSFTQGKEAFDKVIGEDVDAIILLGDIFDSPIPRPEVWSRAAEIMTLPLLAKKGEVRLAGLINKTRESIKERLCFSGIPVIAIHGTHERRPKGQSNPVETLEKLGLLVYLHGNGVILDKGTERMAIQGIGGVPEKYAPQVFRSWNPKPIQNSTNLLIFHQSVKPFIYTAEPALEVGDLPPGFDLYIDGHLHRNLLQKNLLFTGSTMITQMKKEETEGKKVWILTQERGSIKLRDLALQTPRKLFYIEVDANGGTPEEVLEKCRAALVAAVPKTEQKPLVRLKLTGKLRSGFLASDLDLYRLVAEYRTSAIISPDRSELVGEAPETLMMMNLEDAREKNRVSFEELTVELLRGALQKSGFPTESVDLESLYSLLYSGDADAAGEIIFNGRSGGGKK